MGKFLDLITTEYAWILAPTLFSIIIISNSHFAMWCMISNCIGRESVWRTLRANNIMMILFIPAAKKYCMEYRRAFFIQSIFYCIAMIRIAIVFLYLYFCMHGWGKPPSDELSVMYMFWLYIFCGFSVLHQILWYLCNDSQNSGDSEHPLEDKEFSIGESLERLTKRKQIYQTYRSRLADMQTYGNISRRKQKKLLLDTAAALQMVQSWVWYSGRIHGYSSQEALEQDVEFILSDWKLLQRKFEEAHLNRDFERYTDCLIVRSKYLPTLHEAETAIEAASIECKAECLDCFSDELDLMLERVCDVYEKFDEISYPCKTELNPAMNDILHAMEVCETLSGQISGELHQEYVDWFRDVKDEFNKFDML